MRLIALNTTLAAIAELPTFGIVETSTSSTMEPAAFSAMVADSRIGCFPRESAAEITSATRCSTKYGASARPWGPSTDYFTSTSYAYRTKTELLTPKPSITSLSATSTYTEFETAPNNLTKTVYTDTYTWTNYLTTTETVSSIVTVTTSVLQNFTIPTPAGFTAVGAAYPEATQHVDDWVDQDDWSVEDAYWQDQNDYQYGPPPEPELPETSRAGEPTKVDCLVTLVSIYDAGTTTSRSYVPPPTYTRTTYVATETITTTVRTKISPTETPWTYSAASAKEEKSWYTETRTNVDTVSSIFTCRYPIYATYFTRPQQPNFRPQLSQSTQPARRIILSTPITASRLTVSQMIGTTRITLSFALTGARPPMRRLAVPLLLRYQVLSFSSMMVFVRSLLMTRDTGTMRARLMLRYCMSRGREVGGVLLLVTDREEASCSRRCGCEGHRGAELTFDHQCCFCFKGVALFRLICLLYLTHTFQFNVSCEPNPVLIPKLDCASQQYPHLSTSWHAYIAL